ncbi:MAG: 7-cyano-7-deazaguanine synthase [Nostoc sp.]|uniref:7-cyano-7-deazaguanine synthase n=1 Tax=Nostoc sp. TaxID=1180 RepID=UPI002FF96565
MNYKPSTEQKLQDSDRNTYTLEFSPVSNSNGSVRFIDHSQGKERTVARQEKVANEIESIFTQRCHLLRLRIDISMQQQNKFSRARGVVFTLLGTACAYLMGQRILCVYENGIGAINLFYRASAVGLDHTRSVHPLTLLMVGDLVSELLGEKFQVQNPFLFWTKVQMCKALAEDGRNDLASLTMSCDSPHRKSQQPTQCGYCSSCLLRRQALAAANIEDKTPYIVLYEKRSDKDRSEAFLNMREQVRILNNLLSISGETSDRWQALTRRFSDLEDIVDRTTAAENLLPLDMRSRLIQLYQTYVAEWDTVESRISGGLLNNA